MGHTNSFGLSHEDVQGKDDSYHRGH